MTDGNNEKNGMASTKTAIKLQIESIARAIAEEKLSALKDTKGAVKQEVQAQVEQRLRRQHERYDVLVERIETQTKEKMAKVNAQLQEILERVNSCKAELELKKESLSEAQEQLKAEKAAKLKVYEDLRIERRLHRQAVAKLIEDTSKVRVEVRPIRIKEYGRVNIQNVEVISDFKPSHRFIFHTRHIKRKIALVSALIIFSAITFVLSVANGPPAGERGYEMAREQAQPATLTGRSVNIEKPTNNKAADLFGAGTAGPAAGTTDTPVLKSDNEGDIELTVKDEKSITDLDEQPAITATSPPLKLITSANSYIVQSSDDNRWETNIGSHVSYAFWDVVVPADAAIKTVVIFIEHFEEERFVEGKLEWAVGTGWPDKPEVWATIKAPLNKGESNESFDTWDVTSVVDTAEKIKSLQLHIKNNSYSYKSKTLMDYAYAIVEYD